MLRVAYWGGRQYDFNAYTPNVLFPPSILNEKFLHYSFFFQNIPRGLSFFFRNSNTICNSCCLRSPPPYVSIMKGCEISWGKKSFTAELHYNNVIRLTNILSYYLSIFLWEALSYDESHVIHGQSKLNWTLILQSFQIMYFLNIVLCKHKYHSNRWLIQLIHP